MMELIVVILICGIVAISYWMRVADKESFETDGFAGVVYHNLQYTRILSMSLNERYRIVFGPSSYQILNGSNVPVANPETGSTNTNYPTGVSVTNTTVIFDSLGKPYNTGGALSSPLTLTISSGSSTSTVTITPETGFLQ